MYYVDEKKSKYYLNENRYHIRSSYNRGSDSYEYYITAQTPKDGYNWNSTVNELWKFSGNIYYRFYDNGTGKWDGGFIKK